MNLKKIFKKIDKKSLGVNISKGIGLIILLWLINVFIAFVIFTPADEDTVRINITWLITDVLVLAGLYKIKLLNKWAGIFAILTIAFLVLMYLTPISSRMPPEALELNQKISAEYDNKYDYAKALFFEIEKRWTSPVRQYLLEPHKVFFIKSPSFFWKHKDEYADSNIQAQIYSTLLLESNRFTEQEIVLKQKWCVNSPHRVVIIKAPERDIFADLWAVDHFGKANYSFGQYTLAPCEELTGEPY
jgi:hypothetical protein